MGKHVKRKSSPVSRSLRTEDSIPEPEEDLIGFDFLDLDDLPEADDILSEPFGAEDPTQDDGAVSEPVPAETIEAAPSPEAGAVLAPEAEEAPPAGTEPEPAAAEVPEPAAGGKAPAAPRKKKKLSPEARARRERERSKRKFRRGLLAYVIVLLVLIAGTLVFEWISLDRSQQRIDAEAAAEAERLAAIAEQQAYERALHQAPQLAFEAWRGGVTADYWTDLWFAANEQSAKLEDREQVRGYIEGLFAGAQAFKSLDYTAEAPVYVLKNGNDTLARITLSGSELNWSVSDEELLIRGTESASTRVATGSRVFCNGVELGSEYVVNSDSYFDFEPLRNALVNPVTWDTYQVDGLLLKPELTAEPPAGGIVTETEEGDFLLCLDKAAGKTYADKAEAFVRAYLVYYMNGSNNLWGNLYNVRILLVPGTNAYRKMGETADGVYWDSPHYNYEIKILSTGDVVIWADNCYSIDISYDARGTQNGQDHGYNATMRIYFQQINGTFVISDFETL